LIERTDLITEIAQHEDGTRRHLFGIRLAYSLQRKVYLESQYGIKIQKKLLKTSAKREKTRSCTMMSLKPKRRKRDIQSNSAAALRLPWTIIFEFCDGMDAARASACCCLWTRDEIDKAMENRLQETDLGQSLLKRHRGELPLSKLLFCMDHAPGVGRYINTPNTIGAQHFLAWTNGDLYSASDMGMTWCRVLFVIDGIVVFERLLKHFEFTRFPVVRLPLPYLLDVVTLESFSSARLSRQDEMEECWQRGWHEGWEEESDT